MTPGNETLHDVVELLPMTVARPQLALARARAIIAARPGPMQESIARHATGIVLRDLGDLDAARQELRVALRLARLAGDPNREADVMTTLGTVLVKSGRTSAGLAAIDAASEQADGLTRGMVLMRRGGVLHEVGRHNAALRDLRRALAIFRQAGDVMWEGRTRTWLGLAHLALGSTERADAEFAEAERLFARTDQELEVAKAVHNRALVAFRAGDLPAALRHLDAAATRYAELDIPMPDLALDKCAVLRAAGLPAEAFDEADSALADLDRRRGQATKKAELTLAAARGALAAGFLTIASERAVAARRAFATQRRGWWEAHARLLELQARFGSQASSVSPRSAKRAAIRLSELRSDEAPQAWLLAGRVALTRGTIADALRCLDVAAAVRRRKAPALTRVVGWEAAALRAEAAGDSRAVFAACRRGFEVLQEHRLALGATELRARATTHGAELAAIALRAALRTRSPRVLLDWSERWRATELSAPAPRPEADPEIRADLAALREVTRRLDELRDMMRPGLQTAPLTSHLLREQTRLESAIRSRTLRTASSQLPAPAPAPGPDGPAGMQEGAQWDIGDTQEGADASIGDAAEGAQWTIGGMLEALGDVRLVELVQVDGRLHVLVCGGGQVRRFAAGDVTEAAREIDFARFGLDRFAQGELGEPPAEAVAALDGAGRRLQELLLGEAARHLGSGAVVIVPPGRLHAVPWVLLPELRDRVFSVSPSARAWVAGRLTRPFGTSRVLVYGPDLASGRAEVRTLARDYGGATVLGDGTATAEGVLAAVDGARLAHIAAHGTFRADSPLFSSLLLDDGPLTVYDVEALRRAPYQLILPVCESGVQEPAGADELLGLAAALLPRGTVGIVASVVRVNDQAASRVMLGLHERLREGASLAEALRDARQAVHDDPLSVAAGWSFVALGA
jgi:tetratricopeptide (TPR) repeat protein